MSFFSRLTFNSKAAVFALLLAFFALIIGTPSESKKINVNSDQILMDIQLKKDIVTAREVANWIIQGKMDYTLVDIRGEDKYQKYNIPTSVNLSLNEITNGTLEKDQKIVLYCEDDIRTAQIWMLLKGMNYKSVYRILGGINAWKKEILFPSISENASPDEMKQFEKIKEISLFFGGKPKIGGQEVSAGENVELPAPKPAFKAMPKVNKKKKKREGC